MGSLFRRVALVAMVAVSSAMPVPFAAAQEMGETSGQRDTIEVGRRQAELQEAVNRFGDNNVRTLGPLSRLGYAFLEASRYEDAERMFQKQRAVAQANYPAEHVEIAHPLHHLAETYRRTGRCAEAEPLFRQALALKERTVGSQHETTARSLDGLARCQSSLARFPEAEASFKQALDVMEKATGKDSMPTASIVISFADFYSGTFRFDEAEPLLLRALAIRERNVGLKHAWIPPILNSLSRVYRSTERYPAAEAAAKRALAIREELFGAEHEFTGQSLMELGIVYMVMGRYAESERMKRRAVSTFERIFGPEHRATGDALASLAETYYFQGRYTEAADLFQRATAVVEKAVGANHPMLVFPLRMHGQSLRRLGRAADAIPYLSRALAVAEAAYGADNRRTGQSAALLARSLLEVARYDEAEALLRRSLSINQKTLGPDSAAVGFDTLNLARIKLRQNRFAESETLARQAVETLVRQRGAEDYEVGWARLILAAAMENQNRLDPALEQLRQATRSFQIQMDRSREENSNSTLSEQSSYRDAFMDHVFLLYRAQAASATQRLQLTAEAFDVVQLAQSTGTEAAVARMAARFASGTDKLAAAVRAREDAMEQWRSRDATLVQLIGRPRSERDPQHEARLRTELRDLDTKVKGLDAAILRDFPEYAALATPRPATLAEIQSLLRPDEAMVVWLVGRRRTLIMAMRRDGVTFARTDVGRNEINQAVRDLRKGLDPSEVTSLSDVPPFNTTKAHELYKSIFAPIAPALEGAKHVFLVPDAGLQSLPLGVLVTMAPAAPVREMSGYRQVSWLATHYATTVLPSVSALKSLRQFARTARACAFRVIATTGSG